MEFAAFQRAWRQSPIVQIAEEIPADLLTPASVFLRLRGDRARAAFLFESVEGGENVGRYSIIGVDPAETLTLTSTGCVHRAGQRVQRAPIGEFGRLLRSRLPGGDGRQGLPGDAGLTGGWIGYLGYPCAHLFERLPAHAPDRLGHPWAMLGLYRQVVVFDHARQTARLWVTTGRALLPDATVRAAFNQARRTAAQTIRRLKQPLAIAELGQPRTVRAQSNTTPAAFRDGVRRLKKHIGRGDIFQGVLSQRFHVRGAIDAFAVYRRLRRSNPSPYMYYLRFGEIAIAGSSPETLVQKHGAMVTTRPIAGTRPRGADPDADGKLERQLLASVKENAEHIMLVDLGRNDLGRVCRPGSVATTQLRAIDRYSHVMHMVSTVSGKAKPRVDALNVLAAAFPAGTVTGAPKIRAMELIDAIEPEQRGVYAGCVGYIDWHDNLDMAIAIRTAVIDRNGGHVQAGAGIVADSDPDREYHETCNKAAAPLAALGGVIGRH